MSENRTKLPAAPAVKPQGLIPPRDTELMYRVIVNTKAKMSEVNWEKVAEEMGYKNAVVAQTRFRQVRKQMDNIFASVSASASSVDAATQTPAVKAEPGPKASVSKVTKAGAKTTPRKGTKNEDDKLEKEEDVIIKEEENDDEEVDDPEIVDPSDLSDYEV